MHTCMHACTHAHARTHAHTHAHTHARTHACMHERTRACTQTQRQSRLCKMTIIQFWAISHRPLYQWLHPSFVHTQASSYRHITTTVSVFLPSLDGGRFPGKDPRNCHNTTNRPVVNGHSQYETMKRIRVHIDSPCGPSYPRPAKSTGLPSRVLGFF